MLLGGYMFVIATAATILGVPFLAGRYGFGDVRTKAAVAVLMCLTLAYAVGLGCVCHHPYFIDNGSEEFIEWRFRWTWAMVPAGYWQFVVIPAGMVGYGICCTSKRRRQQRFTRGVESD